MSAEEIRQGIVKFLSWANVVCYSGAIIAIIWAIWAMDIEIVKLSATFYLLYALGDFFWLPDKEEGNK